MRPYISEVEFTIQGGGKYALGRKTLIVGPNRIGKTSIVRAVELATTGRVSDVAGRESLALDAELFALAGDNGIEVASASAVWNSESGLSPSGWALPRGKRSKRGGPSAFFPMREVKTALLGSPETARKFFLSVASSLTWDEVLAEIPDQVHAKMEPYKSTDGASGLVAAIEGLKKRARDLISEAKGIRESTVHMAQRVDVAPAGDQLKKLEAEANEAGLRVGDKLGALDKAKTRLELAEVPTIQADDLAIIEAAMRVSGYLSKNNAEVCVICGSSTQPATLAQRSENARKRIDAELRLAKIREEAQSAVREAEFDYEAAKRDLVALQRQMDSLKSVATAAVESKTKDVRDLEMQAIGKENEADTLKRLAGVCTDALSRLVEKSRKGFEVRVQRYLPVDMRFGIEIKDGDRDVFHFGLYRWPNLEEPGILSTALSGAEWAAVTVAISAAVIERADPNAPEIIVPEDRDFDPELLAEVMRTFLAIDAQIIITSTKLPTEIPEGWTVIPLAPPASQSEPKRDPGKTVDLPTGAPDYCVPCGKMIEFGTCPHGVNGRKHVNGKTKATPGDFFS